MIDTQTIRQKILDAAIRGQLIERLIEDGTSDELLEQIAIKKAELQSTKVIKKTKPLPPIKLEEAPFNIPDTWKWVRLDDITSKIASGSTPTGGAKAGVYVPEGAPFIREQNVHNSGLRWDGMVYITEELLSTRTNSTVIAGDILLNITGGSIGRCCLVNDDFNKGSINQHILIVRPIERITRKFIHLYLCSPFAQAYITGNAVGDKDGFSGGRCKRMPIPLPPLGEQERIVERANGLLVILDAIDEQQRRYIEDADLLRSKIIEAGLRGQLTEQLPEDGTASDLLKHIAERRAALQAAKVIRKTKPLPPVSENEEPFRIPPSWKWVHLSDLYRFTNGTASRGTEGGIPHPVLRLADLTDGRIDTSNVRELSLADSEYASHIVERGDLVIIRVNGSREKVATIYQYLDEAEMSYCDHLFCGKSYSNRISPRYISLICRTELVRKQVDPLIKTTAGQNTISQGNLGKTVIPLPPFAEQERIVDRIDAFLSALPK